ncbi:MAG: hypothetical protein J4452_01970 [Candidatus Aenigmarchaeota archaeon]|nr:hypothetical protein [Candidatus Aenigmarchaeota archaeon]
MPKLSDELKEEIRRYQQSGLPDDLISKMTGIGYTSVHYQRPEVGRSVKAFRRNRYKRPEVKQQKKDYSQRPVVKERARAYELRPEVKAIRKAYRKTPEFRKRREGYDATYYYSPDGHRKKLTYQHGYYRRPGVKEHTRDYRRNPEIRKKLGQIWRRWAKASGYKHFYIDDFLSILQRVDAGNELRIRDLPNPYVRILLHLSQVKYPERQKRIIRGVNKVIISAELTELRKKRFYPLIRKRAQLVNYDRDLRYYSISRDGRELIDDLFELKEPSEMSLIKLAPLIGVQR